MHCRATHLHLHSFAMITIDAACFPHILDSVLHQLHLSGHDATLASCRLTCSAVKRTIDSRLPRHRILSPIDPVAPPRKTSLCVNHETLLWNSDTEGWRPTAISEVADLHVTGDLYWPALSAPVPVLRVFDYRALPPPSGAETLILFPDPAYVAEQGKLNRVVELCYEASRIVINMHYDHAPPDFAFRYAPEAELRNSMYRRIGVLENPQELVLMFTPTGKAQDNLRMKTFLEDWTHSVALAVRHNLALNVVLITDGWKWSWFVREEDECLREIEDEYERFVAAFKRLMLVYLDQAPETDPESCLTRISFTTMEAYQSEVGPRTLKLMCSE